jgi:hypothetical protein
MGQKILLVTSHPLSSADAASLVGAFGGPDTEYVIAVPAKVIDTGNPSLFSSNAVTASQGDPSLASVRGDFPGAQGGSVGDPVQIDYGQQSAVEAEAIAGSASDSLRGLGAVASGFSLSDKDVAAHIADAAVHQKVDEVVVMSGHTGLTHAMGADLAARIEHHLKAAGSSIATVRQHRHH